MQTENRSEVLKSKLAVLDARIKELKKRAKKGDDVSLKLATLAERRARVADWLKHPEKDQLAAAAPKPSGQVIRPKGIKSMEAHRTR